MKHSRLFFALLMLSLCNMSAAQVFKCVDSDGRATFTDGVCPKNSSNGKAMRVKTQRTGSAGQADANSSSNVGNNYRQPTLAEQNADFNRRYEKRQADEERRRFAAEVLKTPLAPGVKSRTVIW